jgi:DNA-binding IclR family transcriptional regulator
VIQVIQRALDILEFVAKDPERPKVLGEIYKDLGLNAATCANIVKTLVARGYLDKLNRQKGYILGPLAYGLGGNPGYKKELVDAAKDEMEKLTKKLNENSLLCLLKGDLRVVIERIQSNNDLQANTAVEKRAYDSASGRLLVSMLPELELENFITKYGLPNTDEWEGATSAKTFRKQINNIRSVGFAQQITRNQIIGIAFPVKKDEAVIAALSVYMPLVRFNKLKKESIFKLINNASIKISRLLSQ